MMRMKTNNCCGLLLVLSAVALMTLWLLMRSDYSTKYLWAAGLLLAESAVVCGLQFGDFDLEHSTECYRPKSSSSVIFVILIPLCCMGCHFLAGPSKNLVMEMELLMSLSVTAMIIIKYIQNTKADYDLLSFLLFITPIIVFSVYFSVGKSFLNTVLMFGVLKGLHLIPTFLPKSFTFAEMAIVVQLFMCCVCRVIMQYSEMENSISSDSYKIAAFENVFSVSVVSSTVLYLLTQPCFGSLSFFVVYVLHSIASVLFLSWKINEEPFTWLYNFMFKTHGRVHLMLLWSGVSLLTVIWTSMQGLHVTLFPKASVQTSQSELSIQGNNSFVNRKVFHLFALLVYIPGLMLDPKFLSLASVCIFGVFIILEVVRVTQVPLIGPVLQEVLQTFVDERDQGIVYLTHLYLFAGMSLPIWLSPNTLSNAEAASTLEQYSGVLSLGIGDTIACIAGRTLGNIRWPGVNKTVEGTAFSVAAQILFIYISQLIGAVSITRYSLACLGILITSLVEAFTDQIDNLVLPLVLYPFLCFAG